MGNGRGTPALDDPHGEQEEDGSDQRGEEPAPAELKPAVSDEVPQSSSDQGTDQSDPGVGEQASVFAATTNDRACQSADEEQECDENSEEDRENHQSNAFLIRPVETSTQSTLIHQILLGSVPGVS